MWKIFEIVGNFTSFIKRTLAEVALNGKAIVVYVLNEVPGITDYPGLSEAMQAYVTNPNRTNLIHLLFQALWAGATGHRALKILAKVLRK